jgi:hypothetical protein
MFQRPAALAPAILAVAGLCAGAAHARDIRCLALTGQHAPGTAAGVNFSALEQPSVSVTAGVVMRGTLALGKGVSGANDTAIWRFPLDGSAGSIVVREGDAAPFLFGVTLAELGKPVTDTTSPSVAYWARLAGSGINAANDRAIFSRGNEGHVLRFQAGSAFYGTNKGNIVTLDDFRDNPNNNYDARPALTATVGAGLRGLFAFNVNGDVDTIALQGETVIDLPGEAVYGSYISSANRNAEGDVSYRVSLQHGVNGTDSTNDEAIMVRMAADGSYFWVARRGAIVGHGNESTFETISDPSMTDEPRVGFHGTFRHGIYGVDASNDDAICSLCPCGSLQLNVQEGQSVSNMPSGAVFEEFSLPLFSRDSRLLFGARLRGAGVNASNDSTIWWAEIPYGFVLIAREGSLAPGAGSATFADFNVRSESFWLGTSEGNQLIFPATLSDGRRGLWVFTPYRGLRALVIEGQSVAVSPKESRVITSLATSTEGYMGVGRRTVVTADRRVTFLATVTGGQTGLFVADLPDVTFGCPSDWDNSGLVNSQDFFNFLTDFFAATADINNSGATDSQDFFDFLTAFFGGC